MLHDAEDRDPGGPGADVDHSALDWVEDAPPHRQAELRAAATSSSPLALPAASRPSNVPQGGFRRRTWCMSCCFASGLGESVSLRPERRYLSAINHSAHVCQLASGKTISPGCNPPEQGTIVHRGASDTSCHIPFCAVEQPPARPLPATGSCCQDACSPARWRQSTYYRPPTTQLVLLADGQPYSLGKDQSVACRLY